MSADQRATAAQRPIPYSDDVEVELENEAAIIDETIATMATTMTRNFETMRHQPSGTHAKTHGVVTGRMRVMEDLPPQLAQGLFAGPASYDVLLRFASEPGAVDPDTAVRARGAALKVLDVSGEKLDPQWTSQDFLFNTWPVIPQGDARLYRDIINIRDRYFGEYDKVAAATQERDPRPVVKIFDQTPNIPPVAHRYFSQGAFRYGDYVAKFCLTPVSEAQQRAAQHVVQDGDPAGILAEWTREYFASHGARFELGVQLRTEGSMPVEDASIEWDEQLSPYVPVAVLDFAPQESFSPARRVYAEDIMSWRIWSGLTAFRPLGSINRLRRRVYAELGALRHDRNARAEQNPTALAEIPD